MTQTLDSLAEKVAFTAKQTAVAPPGGFSPDSSSWRCSLRYEGRRTTTPFFMGPGCRRDPTRDEVLDSLLSDARLGEETFPNFCGEIGYDSDSRKAERSWRECVRTLAKMRKFLGDDYEAFSCADR
jgi:hypothetical protein